MNPTVKSCGVLIVRGDPIASFLLMEHADRFDLPKGHVDGEETELECALRELHEETGIQEDDIELDLGFRFVAEYTVQYKKKFGGQPRDKRLVIFLGRLQSDVNIAPTEHHGYRWVDWDPPHRIQVETIDPLLAELERFLCDGRDTTMTL